jgi:hypothetical protein
MITLSKMAKLGNHNESEIKKEDKTKMKWKSFLRIRKDIKFNQQNPESDQDRRKKQSKEDSIYP